MNVRAHNSFVGGASAHETHLTRGDGLWQGRFRAMASPCEVLIECDNEHEARAILDEVADCAWRIESRYSRYRADNSVHAINTSNGKPVTVDAETANLLDFATTLYQLSGGLFDITTGVLRRAWTFDGRFHKPQEDVINVLRPLVGWEKVQWHRPWLQLLPGMQIDLGGICKEYAVDQAAQIASRRTSASCLVNLGGDLATSGARRNGAAWRVGIEAARPGDRIAAKMIDLHHGALATSGDTHRFILADGKRYTHILNPRTCWPVEDAPRSVTVAADTCTQAGMLTTLAVLQGSHAEAFLEKAGVQFWVQR